MFFVTIRESVSWHHQSEGGSIWEQYLLPEPFQWYPTGWLSVVLSSSFSCLWKPTRTLCLLRIQQLSCLKWAGNHWEEEVVSSLMVNIVLSPIVIATTCWNHRKLIRRLSTTRIMSTWRQCRKRTRWAAAMRRRELKDLIVGKSFILWDNYGNNLLAKSFSQ